MQPAPLSAKDLGDALNSLFGLRGDNTSQGSLDWLRPIGGFNSTEDGSIQKSRLSRGVPEVVAITVAYSVVVLCSLIGNTMVVFVIILSRRLHTVTNVFILNLAVSDLMMTLLNIPFNIVRNILEDWPFNGFLCGMVQVSVMTSVYVSSFTMMAIALDRYVVIVYPLRPRMTLAVGGCVIFVSWLLAGLMSLPYALYARVERVELLLHTEVRVRCRLCYPEPGDVYERALTLWTLFSQYGIPMSVTAAAYGHIVRVLWAREFIGTPNVNQRMCHQRARRRTIRMLIVVVLIFCGCWLPLQLYHVLTDWHPDSERFQPQSSVYLACHWLAVSSVCYNPIVYCGLNASFRHQVRMRLRCLSRLCQRKHTLEVTGDIARKEQMTPKRKSDMGSSSSSRHGSRGQCRHLLDKQVVEPTHNRGTQVRGVQVPMDNAYPLTISFLRTRQKCIGTGNTGNTGSNTPNADTKSQWVWLWAVTRVCMHCSVWNNLILIISIYKKYISYCWLIVWLFCCKFQSTV